LISLVTAKRLNTVGGNIIEGARVVRIGR